MNNFTKINGWEFVIIGDERVSDWPLMGSPLTITFIMLIYLLLIYKIGPNFMKNRNPYNIKWILGIYNLSQIIACLYLMKIILSVRPEIYRCHVVDYTNSDLGRGDLYCAYFTLLLKLFELVETVFFVLRKKQNQISKLHVYHHISTASLSWIMVKYMGGGLILSSICLNSFIHVIMYSYYFAALFGKNIQNKFMFIKKSITTLQMIQFSIILSQILYCFISGEQVSALLICLFIPNVTLLFYFFYNFYMKAYRNNQMNVKNNDKLI